MGNLLKRASNGYRVGDSHHNATLTDHEVELMRQLHDEGLPVRQLALLFGVSDGHVSKVVRYLVRR